MTSIQKEMLSIKSEILELKELIINNNSNHKEILSAEEVMELLKINRSTFDRLRKEGFLKAYRMKRKLYCKYSEILESINNGFLEEFSK